LHSLALEGIKVGKTPVIHPVLFALYPVLFLYSYNIDKTPVKQMFISIIITILFTVIIWLLAGLIVKNIQKAGLLASLFLILFFTYGRAYDLLYYSGIKIKEPRYLLIIWLLIFIFISYFLITKCREFHNFTRILNCIGVILVSISLFNIIIPLTNMYLYNLGLSERTEDTIKQVERLKTDNLPNIYYIILDSYVRDDVLKEVYKYDNSDFLNYLKEKGFYIADKSRSNYCQTFLSVASSLNTNYLDNTVKLIGDESTDRSELIRMIQYNRVVSFLKQYDYTFVAFSTGYNETEIWNADLYINSRPVTEFQFILIMTTPLPDILGDIISPYDVYRYQFLHTLELLPETTKMKSPIFIFVHLQGPHTPFIFGENGEKTSFFTERQITSKETYYKEGYRKQLHFVNKKVKETIDKIISNSSVPPVIILQGDHGTAFVNLDDIEHINPKQMLSILNAYYLPGNGREKLYRDITPVNSFRVIFNYYFNTNLPILKDKSYLSTEKHPYKFMDVTDKINIERRK